MSFLFLILLIAFTFRFFNLTSFPIFADEAIYIRWAQVMRSEPGLRFLPLSDGKQPLFMWVAMPFLKFISDPLVAGRLVSVFSGVSTMFGVFTLSYVLFKSKKSALVSATFYAVSPYAVFFDRMALVDSMLAMFGVWGVVFLLLSIKHQRLDMAMLAGFAFGGASLTKSPALFYFLMLPSTLIFLKNKGKLIANKTKIITSLGFVLVTSGLAFAIYNILRLGENFHLVNSRNLDYVFPLSHLWENPLDPFIANISKAFSWIITMGPELAILFVVLAVTTSFSKYKKELLFLLVWAILPIIIQSVFAKVFTARYIFFTLPYWYILGGAYFVGARSARWKKIGFVLLFLSILQSAFMVGTLITNHSKARLPENERMGYLVEWSSGTGIREVAEYIKSEHEKYPDTAIVVGTEGYFGTLPDGLQIYLEKVPNVNVIGVGLGIKNVPKPLVESAAAGNKTFLVANSSRLDFSGNVANYGLLELASFPKDFRQDGTRDYLHLFIVKPGS